MSKLQPIVFYFPFRGIGGVSVLFLRLAEYLSRDRHIFVADYSDGYMAQNIGSRVELIRIDKDDEYPRDCIFVFQSFLPWRFPYLTKVDKNARVLFWSLHPHNFNPAIFNENSENVFWLVIAKAVNFLSRKRKLKVKQLVEYLLSCDALAIMDRENLRTTAQFIGRELEIDEYLPVATLKPLGEKVAPISPKTITCAWIGRLADFKYRILEHLMVRLNFIRDSSQKIHFVVIGDGEYAEYLKSVAGPLESESLSIEFIGELASERLNSYLLENVDIVFAMGTSALEAASLRIPVFLTDYSFKRVANNYRFSLIYENSGYCLGEEISDRHFEVESSLNSSIMSVMDNYGLCATRCYEYWAANFSMEAVSARFVQRATSTAATFSDMEKRGFFTSDMLGFCLRYLAWTIRHGNSQQACGFRHDC